ETSLVWATIESDKGFTPKSDTRRICMSALRPLAWYAAQVAFTNAGDVSTLPSRNSASAASRVVETLRTLLSSTLLARHIAAIRKFAAAPGGHEIDLPSMSFGAFTGLALRETTTVGFFCTIPATTCTGAPLEIPSAVTPASRNPSSSAPLET